MTPRRYQTRRGVMQEFAIIGGISGAVMGAMQAYSGEHSWLALPLWTLGGALGCALFAAPIAWQRLVLDERAGYLRYHNSETFHRWHKVPLADVLEVRYDYYGRSQGGLISGLYLLMRDGTRPGSHRLRDNEMGNSRGPSPMFRDVASAVLRAQPSSLVDPILLAGN